MILQELTAITNCCADQSFFLLFVCWFWPHFLHFFCSTFCPQHAFLHVLIGPSNYNYGLADLYGFWLLLLLYLCTFWGFKDLFLLYFCVHLFGQIPLDSVLVFPCTCAKPLEIFIFLVFYSAFFVFKLVNRASKSKSKRNICFRFSNFPFTNSKNVCKLLHTAIHLCTTIRLVNSDL